MAEYEAALIKERTLAGLTAARARTGGLTQRLPELPDEAVIEVSARVGSDGPVPLPTAPVPPEMAGLIGHVSGYEELALQATLHGGRQRVHRALLAHPLVAQHEKADALTDQLIAAGAQHLAWVQ